MRWSLFSLVALLAVLTAEVTALPTPQDGPSELSPECQAVTKPNVGSVKVSNFKKSSQTYRNAALRKRPMFSVKAGNHVESKAPKRMSKGMDADHSFIMGHAADKISKAHRRKGSHVLNKPERPSLVTPFGLSVL